jgi:hypothetical protein
MQQASEEEGFLNRIQQWSQGDCVLGDFPIFWGFNKEHPLTEISLELAEESDSTLGISIGADQVEGLVVISQTCDIVRKVSDRPFVQVVPIVQVHEKDVETIRLRMRPRFAYLPALSEKGFVADLDRVLTIEKAFLAEWSRYPAFENDSQRRSFIETIRRYYDRPAFPDIFVNGIKKLAKWIHEKHDRESGSGRNEITPSHPGIYLRALEMVLVRARPSWEAESFSVEFILVRKSDEDGISASAWEEFKSLCERKVDLPMTINSRWVEMSLSALPAKLYLECDQLDLNYLSDETRRRP